MTRKDVCVNISKARISKNLAMYELSLRLGKSPNYMHGVECGRINISLDMLLKICEVLEIDPKDLFC